MRHHCYAVSKIDVACCNCNFKFLFKKSFKKCPCNPDRIWKCYVSFEGEWKTGVPREKPLRAREGTIRKLNPQMAPSPGFEPGPHWWEVSALTTVPPLLPEVSCGIMQAKKGLFLKNWPQMFGLGWTWLCTELFCRSGWWQWLPQSRRWPSQFSRLSRYLACHSCENLCVRGLLTPCLSDLVYWKKAADFKCI